MYDIIYSFFINNLLSNNFLSSCETEIFGQTITFAEWLGHTLTITSIILLFVLIIFILKWFFKLGANIFHFN